LKIALQHQGEEQIRAFWKTAEEQVAKRRQELKVEQEKLRSAADRQLQAEVARRRNSLLSEAQTRAMANRLHAEADLDERLQELASQVLVELAANNREALWRALCAELPPAKWRKIELSQADRFLAAQDFPQAEIALDDTLAGGLIVTGCDGGVKVDNSLDCRLRRAWPDLLPQLMKALRKLVDRDETT